MRCEPACWLLGLPLLGSRVARWGGGIQLVFNTRDYCGENREMSVKSCSIIGVSGLGGLGGLGGESRPFEKLPALNKVMR